MGLEWIGRGKRWGLLKGSWDSLTMSGAWLVVLASSIENELGFFLAEHPAGT